MGVLRTVLLVLVGASSAAAADKKFLRLGDTNFTELVLDSEDTWLLLFGATCSRCQKILPALKATANAIGEFEDGGGGPATQIATLSVSDAPKTYEMFWIETVPSLFLLHPNLNAMYAFVGDEANGGLCCLEDDACGGDTELFQKCLGPLDDTLKQFALNLDPEASSCRGEENTIPRPRTVWDHPLLKAPGILYGHLEKEFGWQILWGVIGCISMLCSLSIFMMHNFLVGSGSGKKTKKKKASKKEL